MTAEIVIFPGERKRKPKPSTDFDFKYLLREAEEREKPKPQACPACGVDRFWLFSDGTVQCAKCLEVAKGMGCFVRERPFGA